jgi:hypothetical protein
MMRSIKNVLRVVSAISSLAAIIATPTCGYLWFKSDPANPEAMYYFLTSLFCLTGSAFSWLYVLAPNEEDLARWEKEKKDRRVKYAYIADGIENEIGNFEKLASGRNFVGPELKAVADYSFKCIKEQAEQLPRKLRFRFLVAAIIKEADRQLQITDWASRNPHKLLQLSRTLLPKVKRLAATEQELLNDR